MDLEQAKAAQALEGWDQATQPQRRVVWHQRTWAEFVDSLGVKRVDLYDYYLGKTAQGCSDAEHAQVIAEIFADAILAGALTMPQRYSAEDFSFHVKSEAHGRKISITQRAYPNLSLPLVGKNYYLDLDPRMVSQYIF